MTDVQKWVLTPQITAAGWTLFYSLWQGAIIGVALGAILLFTRAARKRYAAACIALCAAVVCFIGTWIRFMPTGQGPSQVRHTMAFAWNTRELFEGGLSVSSPNLGDALRWLVPFWIAGVIAFYLRNMAGWAFTLRLRSAGVCCAPEFWVDRLSVLARRLRISRPVALVESSLAAAPVVIGYVRPVILIPIGLLTGMSAGQIESILLHELAHIRRQDYLVNTLQIFVEGLLFYHPVIWWISGVIRTEREHCCDDVAVVWSGGAHRYASALAALEENRGRSSHTALAATGGNLVKRVRRLLIPTEKSSSALTPVVSAAILIITAAVGLTAWQAKAPASPGGPEIDPPAEMAYYKWLNEDVVYIISPKERAAFENLETNQDREEFIKQFWQRRDPTPGTAKNEFKEEHYRRIAQANLRFPTATGKAGWKTDRGRIYILFGPPDEIDDHSSPGLYNRPEDGVTPNGPHSFPYIDWTYRYIDGVGTNVTMEFVDRTGTHDFHMTLDPDSNAGRYVAPPGAHEPQ